MSAAACPLSTARRTGEAGRNGITVGTHVCADRRCSEWVRRPAPG
ncbi:FBP domain-containing protein [Blastococcus sp. HT6-30]